MKCPFCDIKIIEGSPEIVEHLLVLLTKEGGYEHTYVHGPVDDKSAMLDLIQTAAKEAGIETSIEA